MGRKKREKNRLRQEINLLLLIWLLIYVTRPQAKGEVLGEADMEPDRQIEAVQEIESEPAKKEVSLIEVKKQLAQPENEVEVIIEKWAGEHGVSSETMKAIARCESGLNPRAVNGIYGGLFQFCDATWISTRKAMGEEINLELRFDASESAKTAAFKMARDGFGAWENCMER